MDLELALGRDVGEMSERDFRRWRQYANRKGLPTRRLEMYLAQVAFLLAHLLGESKAPLSSFLFDVNDDPKPAKAIAAVELADMKRAFGFNPRRRRRK